MSLVQRQNIFEPAQEAPNSTANRTLFQSQESELVGGQEARVRLPHSNNTFIDTSQSFLQFDLGATIVGTNLGTPVAVGSLPRVNMCDLGAESCIQNISVFCGGRLVNQFNPSDSRFSDYLVVQTKCFQWDYSRLILIFRLDLPIPRPYFGLPLEATLLFRP